MNQEKYRKNAFQQSQSEEEDPVPTHSRSSSILRKYIKIPRVFFGSRRRRSPLLQVQDQKISLISQEKTNNSPED